jgi:hypothetical protein
MRLSSSSSSDSLDAAATVPLIECVDRSLGRVRFSMASSVRHRPVAGTRERPLSRLENRAQRFLRLHQFDPIAERIVNVDAVIALKRFILAYIMSRRLQPND